ncbi:hypothetical protein BDW22DRAFT_1347045 [Trametopsis cervina]|nr:hypothetical protein BDW22DRAFT_1347045 [Trametopsis cervina]
MVHRLVLLRNKSDRSPGETTERSNQAADSDSDDSEMADDEDRMSEVPFGGSILPAFEPSDEQDGSAAGQDTTVHPNESSNVNELQERPASPSLPSGEGSHTSGGPTREALPASPPVHESALPARSTAGDSSDEDDEDGDWLMEAPLPAFVTDGNTSDEHQSAEDTESAIDTTMAELPTFTTSSPSSEYNGSEGTGEWGADLPAFEEDGIMGDAADHDKSVEGTTVGTLHVELNSGEVNDPREREQISLSPTALPSVVREVSLSGSEESVILNDASHGAVHTHRGIGEAELVVSALAQLPSFGDAPMEDTSDSASDSSARKVESPTYTDPPRPAGSGHASPLLDTHLPTNNSSYGRSSVAEDNLSGLGLLPAFGDPPVAYEKGPSVAESSRMSSRSRSSRVVSFAGVEEEGAESDSEE